MVRRRFPLNILKNAFGKEIAPRLEIILYHFVTDRDHAFCKQGHRVRPDVLHRQLRYLKDHYTVVSIEEIPFLLNDSKGGPYVAVCFDDGYQDCLTEAYPILEVEKVPATLFVCPSVIDNRDLLWRDKLRYLSYQGMTGQLIEFLKKGRQHDEYRLELLEPDGPLSFHKWSKRLAALNGGAIQEDVDRFLDSLGVSGSLLAERQALFISCTQLREYPYLSFGNHTWSHPLLPLLDCAAQLEEVQRADDYLRQHHVSPRSLAVPFGRYNEDTIRVCKQLGYLMMFTTFNQSNAITRSGDNFHVLDRRLAPGSLEKLAEVL